MAEEQNMYVLWSKDRKRISIQAEDNQGTNKGPLVFPSEVEANAYFNTLKETPDDVPPVEVKSMPMTMTEIVRACAANGWRYIWAVKWANAEKTKLTFTGTPLPTPANLHTDEMTVERAMELLDDDGLGGDLVVYDGRTLQVEDLPYPQEGDSGPGLQDQAKTVKLRFTKLKGGEHDGTLLDMVKDRIEHGKAGAS